MRKIFIFVLILSAFLMAAISLGQQIPPSYHQGFARSAGESAHPERWKALKAIYPFSLGITGSTAFDQSPFKIHGTLTNMEDGDWVVSNNPRVPGYALRFDGVDELITIGETVMGPPITFVADVVVNSLPAASGYGTSEPLGIMAVYRAAAHNDGENIIGIGVVNNGSNQWVWCAWQETGRAIGSTVISIGQSYRIVGVFRSNSDREIFVNAISEGTNSLSRSVSPIDTTNIGVGDPDETPSRFMDITVTYAAIYDKGFIVSEISADYANSLKMFELRRVVYKSPAVAATTLIQQVIIY